MEITFLGVRGSLPTPGPATAGVGGNTACVALAHDGEAPSLLLDGGTGLVNYPRLDPRPFRGTVLLSHLHWDHAIGLPFWRGGDVEGSSVSVRIPKQDIAAGDLAARLLSPPLFSINPEQLRGSWSFADLDEGVLESEGFHVLAREVPHKGGRTFGYRVGDGTGSIAYVPDHAPQVLGAGADGLGPFHPAVLALVEGVDVLVHDAQYTAAELPSRGSFGHAAAEYAVRLGEAVGVGRVVLFHHDPGRSDEEVEAIRAGVAAGAGVPVEVALEMARIRVGEHERRRDQIRPNG